MKDALKKIENHFNNISKEEFEENLVKCGFGEIKGFNELGIEILLSEEDREKALLYSKYGNTANNIK